MRLQIQALDYGFNVNRVVRTGVIAAALLLSACGSTSNEPGPETDNNGNAIQATVVVPATTASTAGDTTGNTNGDTSGNTTSATAAPTTSGDTSGTTASAVPTTETTNGGTTSATAAMPTTAAGENLASATAAVPGLTTPTVSEASITDIVSNPESYLGQTVTVISTPREMLGDRAFRLNDSDSSTAGATELLVIDATGAAMTDSMLNQPVRITGVVTMLDLPIMEQQLGVELDDSLFSNFVDQPVLVATSVEGV